MKIEEASPKYATATVPTDAVLTFDGYTQHPTFGRVKTKIYRSVNGVSESRKEYTISTLKESEPDVGLWPGDVIQYFDEEGIWIGEVECGY